jgi:release factor glutamine methyltransferase
VALSAPTVDAALTEAEAALAAAGVETPRVDAEWLLAGILDVGRAALAVNARRPLIAATASRYADAVRRRARREPLQRILGWEEFRGLRFRLTRDVLVPRPETELLVEWALGFLPAPSPARRLRAVDVGTGSGCIACALAHARADLDVVALDVSPAVCTAARANVDALGLERRVRVIAGDLSSGLGADRVDLVVANLPYLPDALLATLAPEVGTHDPRLALAGGADGLDLVRRLVVDAPRVLRPGAAIVLETAGDAQAATAADLFARAGFVDVRTRADLAGIVRFVAGRAAAREECPA